MLVGDTGTGKTCLLMKYADDTFSETTSTTVGIDFRVIPPATLLIYYVFFLFLSFFTAVLTWISTPRGQEVFDANSAAHK
jgi:Ras of Complex, Roc, domain of DAPkinase